MHAWGGFILGKITRSFLAVIGGVAAFAAAYASFIGVLGTASVDYTTASSVHSVNLLAAQMAESNLSGGLTSGSSALNGASVQVVGQARLDTAAVDTVAPKSALQRLDTAIAASNSATQAESLGTPFLPWVCAEATTTLRNAGATAAAAAARELDKLHVVSLTPIQEEFTSVEEFLTQPSRNVSERLVSNLEVPDEPDEGF